MSESILAILIASCASVAVSLFVYSLYQIKQEVPDDDREYMDPLPPMVKLIWPLISIFAHYIGERLSVEYIEKSKINLQRSGLGYMLTPQQFFGLQVVSGILCGVVTWWCLSMLDKPAGLAIIVLAVLGFLLPQLNLSDRRKKRENEIIRLLPVYLDFITMSVEAGMNLNGALMQAVDKAPKGALNIELQKVLRDIKAGVGKIDALRNMSERLEIKEISNLVSALAQAEKSGASVGVTLRIQSDQRRVERFQRAEKLAMQAPVKLVGPLVMFIFPTTFIILFFPIATQLVDAFS
ncbi:type II secretion system F family protein [Pleionea litopenaei]|uniref:Type II secretion system F family protein n=1 Tax=Pleionea litopenaei TaxID=3070815 RepID=A0AA51RTL3_9GAMM|nr:type II secretion system F family protein [Pleionea sp. HL-JVS1]WMS87253.1 type II secretion system F family protein [Pleionea sp. HL-JVS1]